LFGHALHMGATGSRGWWAGLAAIAAVPLAVAAGLPLPWALLALSIGPTLLIIWLTPRP